MATDYGTDIDCGADLAIDMRETSGWLMLAQACVRRLKAPRGSLFYDPDYGYDLTGFVGAAKLPSAGQIENELLKDKRLSSVDVRVIQSGDGSSFDVRITATAYELGPFDFTIAASAVTAELLLEGTA